MIQVLHAIYSTTLLINNVKLLFNLAIYKKLYTALIGEFFLVIIDFFLKQHARLSYPLIKKTKHFLQYLMTYN